MRRRPFLLAAAAVAAGVAALGTVAAQVPGGTLPATTVRPYSSEATRQQPQQPGAVRPAGGYLPPPAGYTGPLPPGAGQPVNSPNRPRLTNPVIAGPDGVRPAGGLDLPPPRMELPAARPPAGAPSPAAPLPPPSVAIDPPAAPGTPPPQPLVPVPPAGPVPVPLPGPLPSPTPAAPAGGNPTPLPAPRIDTGLSPAPGATIPAAGLPARTSHTLSVEAVCPETIVFGQEFRYEIVVRNGGTAAVAGVRVEDEIPAGAKYVGSDPPAEMTGDRLAWPVGTLDAGAEKRIAVRVKPGDEGEVRSRATVSFAAAVDARTKVTRPRLVVAVAGPEVCKAGEEATFQIKLSNTGSGPAQRMLLQARLSDGFLHPQGAVIEAELANLPAGETKTVPLKVSAAKAGAQWCQVTVAAEGSPDAAVKAAVNVVEPQLQVKQTGPAKCLVKAEPVYEITLANPGTAATDAVTVYAVLPEGFEYVQGSDGAAFSATNRAVVWKLAGLAPGGTKALSLKLRAAAASDGLLRTIAQAGPEHPPQATGVVGVGGVAVRPAARVLEAKAETVVKAEGVAAVRFEVLDVEDPVEAGKEAQYEIRVINQGTGACTNVQLVAALADGTAHTGSNGPTQVKAQGQNLIFEPIATLAVKGEAVYRVRVRGTVAGDQRFRVQLTCDQVRTPVIKEESTRFYKQ